MDQLKKFLRGALFLVMLVLVVVIFGLFALVGFWAAYTGVG